MSRSPDFHLHPASSSHSAHLWKAVAPFVSLEEQLFAHETQRLEECAESFVAGVLPEANPLGRAA